jgi:hypothetical protein
MGGRHPMVALDRPCSLLGVRRDPKPNLHIDSPLQALLAFGLATG